MKSISLTHSILLGLALMLASGCASAQSAPGNSRAELAAMPALPANAAPQSRPADGGDAVPPGFGGVNGRGTRGNGNGNANGARNQLPRLHNVCGPGGALSGEATNGQIGRNRARARVCDGG